VHVRSKTARAKKHASVFEIESERGPNLFYIATLRRVPHIRLTNMYTGRTGPDKNTVQTRRHKKVAPFPENAGAISDTGHCTRPIATQTQNQARDKISKSGQITVHQKWR
jgi:hypothetical protein